MDLLKCKNEQVINVLIKRYPNDLGNYCCKYVFMDDNKNIKFGNVCFKSFESAYAYFYLECNLVIKNNYRDSIELGA